MTLGEVVLFVEAKREREEMDYKAKLMYDYTLARNTASFVGLVFNGKQIPSFEEMYPSASEKEEEKEQGLDWRIYKAQFEKFAITRNELMKRGK